MNFSKSWMQCECSLLLQSLPNDNLQLQILSGPHSWEVKPGSYQKILGVQLSSF